MSNGGIENGDKFRIFSNNPHTLPLPHPILLEIHGMLWRMIQSAGIAESARGKKRRLAEAALGEDDGGNEGGRVERQRGTREDRGRNTGRGTSRIDPTGGEVAGVYDTSGAQQNKGVDQHDHGKRLSLGQGDARPDYNHCVSSVSSRSTSFVTLEEDDMWQSHSTASSFDSLEHKRNPKLSSPTDQTLDYTSPLEPVGDMWHDFQSRMNELWLISHSSSRSSSPSPSPAPSPIVESSQAWVNFQLHRHAVEKCWEGEEESEEYSGDESCDKSLKDLPS